MLNASEVRGPVAIIVMPSSFSREVTSSRMTRISGWAAIGGLVKNPNVLDRSASGSSSGTGAAVAASLAAAGVGTETDGSITSPAAVNGIVGIKPTVGLVSRTHVVPISHNQDTPGPMARSVADVAALLTAMAGSDPADPATAAADSHKRDYVAALAGATLRGKRLGVLRFATGQLPEVDALFDRALATLRAGGAEILELKDYKPDPDLGNLEFAVLIADLKADLNAYLATTPPAVQARTLADVIAFDRAHPRELALFGQEFFEQAEATKGLDDPAYVAALAKAKRLAGADGIDKLLADNHLDALIGPSDGPASRIDVAAGDHLVSGGISTLPAIAGYPHLTVPMGQVDGLPVGISFVGPAWSEDRLLALGEPFERAAHARRPPQYVPSLEATQRVRALLAPER